MKKGLAFSFQIKIVERLPFSTFFFLLCFFYSSSPWYQTIYDASNRFRTAPVFGIRIFIIGISYRLFLTCREFDKRGTVYEFIYIHIFIYMCVFQSLIYFSYNPVTPLNFFSMIPLLVHSISSNYFFFPLTPFEFRLLGWTRV